MGAPVLYLVKTPAVEPPQPPCPVCGLTEALGDYSMASMGCTRCGTQMHGECFWGRVATLEEWQDYMGRWIKPSWGDVPKEPPPCLCPTCRAREGGS